MPATRRPKPALVWGVHPQPFAEARTLGGMVEDGVVAAVRGGLAGPGDEVLIVAGFPSGQPGSTNLLHLARVPGCSS